MADSVSGSYKSRSRGKLELKYRYPRERDSSGIFLSFPPEIMLSYDFIFRQAGA